MIVPQEKGGRSDGKHIAAAAAVEWFPRAESLRLEVNARGSHPQYVTTFLPV